MIVLPGRVLLVLSFLPFSTLNISWLLTLKVSAGESAHSFFRHGEVDTGELSLLCNKLFSLGNFKILYF